MNRPTQENPISLPLWSNEVPKPVPGCYLCDNIAHERSYAVANGNASLVSDLNVRLRRHLSAQHADRG
ncbi:hypothetical protein [Streptomyces sp. NRRL F-5630]|uniref:hypothetical protein n=1 Tax=Streptomyces sp. NRRL F-5630 TaxID=1463864 RepID=UPI003EC094C9